jgi:hypothetical protein
MMHTTSILGLSLLMMMSVNASAVETQIMVRAKAVDAKYIGSSVGGVKVIVEDAETGEILDQGWIKGGTGSTDRLIKNPIIRGERLTDDLTAGYVATVDISNPRLLRFKTIGPYGFRQSLQEATVTSWIIPGKHILGDGITLTMPGMIVDSWTQVLKGGHVTLFADASLLCGCPIFPEGHWEPEKYEATAIIMQDDKKVDEIALNFTGPIGIFSAKTTLHKSGHYKAIVYLYDKNTGNVGVDRTMFEVTEK